MKHLSALSLAFAIAASNAPASVASHAQQDAYHPTGTASAPAAKVMPGKSKPTCANQVNGPQP